MNNKDKGLANIGLGVCGVVLGLEKMFGQSFGRPTGKWSVIFGPLFDSFGPKGPALASIAIGMVFVIFGLVLRGKK